MSKTIRTSDGNVYINQLTFNTNDSFMSLPAGDVLSRPEPANEGSFRYNTALHQPEWYDGYNWQNVSSGGGSGGQGSTGPAGPVGPTGPVILNGADINISNIADLRSTSVSNVTVNVLGYYIPGDGGGNQFFGANQAQFTGAITSVSDQATFTGAIADDVLTVSVISTGTILNDLLLVGSGVTDGTFIMEQLSGTYQGIGTYRVTKSQTVASVSMALKKNGVVSVSGLQNTIYRGMRLSWTGATEQAYVLDQYTTNSYFVAASGNVPTQSFVGLFQDDGGTIIVPGGGDGSTAWVAFYNGTVDALQFGLKGNGLAADNDHIAAQAAFNFARVNGGMLTFPKKKIMFTKQVIVYPASKNLEITGYGTEILTQGNIAAFKTSVGGSPWNTTFKGFYINHRLNTDARRGIWMVGSSSWTIKDILVHISSQTGKNCNTDALWKFNVSAISIYPVTGAVYDIGGVTLTISAVNLVNTGSTGAAIGSGTIEGFVSSAPASSGIMTKTSGTGDATISYTNAVNNNYAAIWMEDTSDTSYLGCYWTLIDGLAVRPNTGGDGLCPFGIYMRGAQNSVRVINSKFQGSYRNIYATHYPNRQYVPNGNEICGNSVELHTPDTYYVTLYSDSAINYHASGWKISNHRVEAISYFVSLEGTAYLIQTPLTLINNQGGVVKNPNNVPITNYDVNMPVSSRAPPTRIENCSGFIFSQAYTGIFNYAITKGSISGEILTIMSTTFTGLFPEWIIGGAGIPAGTRLIGQETSTWYNDYTLTVSNANIPTLPTADSTFVASNGLTYTIVSNTLSTADPSSRSGNVIITGPTVPPANSTLIFGTGTGSNITYTTVTPGTTQNMGGAGTYRLSNNCGTNITATSFTVQPPVPYTFRSTPQNGQGVSWTRSNDNVEFARLDYVVNNPSAGSTNQTGAVFGGAGPGTTLRGLALRNISGISLSQEMSYNLAGTISFNAERTKNVRFPRMGGYTTAALIWGSITNDVLTTGSASSSGFLTTYTSVAGSTFITRIKGIQTGSGPYTYNLFPTYAFVVSGITADPPIGSTYFTKFGGTPASSGTLTKINGTGDNIPFTASAANLGNNSPFEFTVTGASIAILPVVGTTYKIADYSEIYTVTEVYITGGESSRSGTVKFTATVNAVVASAKISNTIQFLCDSVPVSSGILTKAINGASSGDNGITYSSATANPLYIAEQEMYFNQQIESNGLYTVLLDYEGSIELDKPLRVTTKSRVGFTIDSGTGQFNYVIIVTTPSLSPTAGAVYRINNVNYTIIATSIVSTTTVLQVSGPSAPPTTGTLTRMTPSATGSAQLSVSSSLDLFAFSVFGILTLPTVNSTYTDANNVTYTIRSVSYTTHTAWGTTGKTYGTIYASATLGTLPPASGSLTKASGTGDLTVAFSAVTNFENRISGNVRWMLVKNST